MLSSNEVQHIAKLARIELSEKDIAKFQKELASILEYFEILAEVEDSNAQPMIHAVSLQNIVREDRAKPKSAKEAAELLAMAPGVKDGYLKVKSIL